MSSFGYCPLIRRPTRVTVQAKSLVYHIWTNEPYMILDSGNVLSDLSNHFPILACIKGNLIDSCDERFVSFKNRLNNEYCDNNFREVIKNADWSLDEIGPSVNELYESSTDKIYTANDCAYPLVEIRRQKVDLLKSYIDSDLRNLIKENHRIQSLY